MSTESASRPREPRRPASGRGWPWAQGIVIALAGLLLLGLAVPYTVSSVLMLPGNPILNAVLEGRTVSQADLETLLRSRERALAWIDSGRAWTDRGLAELRLARRAGLRTAEGRDYLRAADSSIRRGLALAPANPYAWARLAYVRLLRSGLSIEVAEALKMSIYGARYDARLLFSRLQLCLLAWSHFDAVGQDLVRGQIRLAWTMDEEKLAALSRRTATTVVVREALADEPGAVERFDTLLSSAT